MEMERWSDEGRRETVAERLERHPELKERMERLLDVVENTGGDVKFADEAERRAIEGLRVMGQQVMQAWGDRLAVREAQALEETGGVVRHVKKLHWTWTFGEISVQEQTYQAKEGGSLCRPFQQAAQISCRGYSTRLQRAITDFGADVAFGRVPR
jgi:hypothetical protein